MFSFPFSAAGGSSFGRNHSRQERSFKRMPVNKEGHFTTVDGIPVRKLFIANLTPLTVERHLVLTFRTFGNIVDVSIIKTPNDKSNKSSFGFITFETPAEATRALKKRHSLFILNRKVYVFPADSWHQPLELPNGEILWDRRKAQTDVEAENNVADEDKISGIEDAFAETLTLTEGEEADSDCLMSKLNDDCLLLIFDWLPMNERLVLNKVCRRWKLLNMRMWHGIKKLDFTVPPLVVTSLSDELLRNYLSLCPNVTHINIAQDGHKLTADAIVTIANCCKKLESIVIRDIKIHKRSLAFLARSCPMLKSFSMDACTIQHDGEMVALVKKSALEEISLKYSASSVGLWLKFLHPPLKSMSLEMYEFNSEYLLQGIRNVKDTLKELRFVSCESIRSKDVEMIASIVPELNSLTLAGGFIDFKSHSLTPITKLKKLTRLDLDNNAFVCDHFLNQLSQECSLLKYLSLSDDRYLTVQGLSVLSKFTRLTHLTLACLIKLDDSILKSISQKIKNLQHLDLMGCSSITDEGCQSIVTNCKELEILDVSGCMHVTNLTVTAAIESSLKSSGKKKLKIIAGESGIDVDICWSSEVTVDPSSSIMSQYPGAMLIIDPEFRYEDDFFNNLFIDEYDYDDLYDDDSESYFDNDYDDDDDDDDDDEFNNMRFRTCADVLEPDYENVDPGFLYLD
ncbi:F-box/LRR-repeat protein fbxl-1 isoform X2 [Halyomorpha halys]|uniref:F-box/LRR-repeat protein fbxl-1 isoform X2 n=1 Tax=Halyomorpha halys TaxID=286706 RepID=UPI0006D4D68E|nr:uncharacterized protein LOC106681037 isoform X2 [Halyomorpha halys]